MTNEQILKKAIKKAVKNGWIPIYLKEKQILDEITNTSFSATFYIRKKYSRKHIKQIRVGTILSLTNIIFSHDFAKAFWGEEMVCEGCGIQECYDHTDKDKQEGVPNYIFHLRQMVCCGWSGIDDIGMSYPKEPLKYIEKFL